MTTLSYTIADTSTMLRRNMKHLLRYPTLLFIVIAMPAVFLLLFVYVFGGTLGNGLGGLSGGRAAYVNYVTPAIIMLTIASAVQSTAISVASDMTEGIIARFRTMSIARSSVLTGHVIASMILSVWENHEYRYWFRNHGKPGALPRSQTRSPELAGTRV